MSGVTGATGPVAATGPSGAQGVSGVTGATGPVAATGPSGAQGVPGVTGATGPVAATGPSGAQGVSGVTGATGPVAATGPSGPRGDTGAQGPGADPAIIDNIGTFAYVKDIRPVEPWFVAGTEGVIYSARMFGNSSRYDWTLSLNNGPTGPTHTATRTTLYNNNPLNPGGCVQTVATGPGGTFTAGTSYPYIMDANTRYAGGTGPGSTVTRSGTITLQGDPLTSTGPNPDVTPSVPTVNILPPSETPGGYVWISGTQYPTAGSIFEIPDGSLTINNMYFINKTPGNPRTVFYSSLAMLPEAYYYSNVGNDSGSHLYRNVVNESGTNLQASGLAPPASGSVSNPYGETYKNISWRHTGPTGAYPAVRISEIYFKANVGNAVGATTTLNNVTPNVTAPVGVGSAYVIPTFNERDIPTGQNPGADGEGGFTAIVSGIRRFGNTSISPQTPALADIINRGIQFASVSANDAILNPLTMLIGTTGGTKYLTLNLNFTAALPTFKIRLGTSLISTLRPSMFLQWFKPETPTPTPAYSSGWFDANIASDGGGCGNGDNTQKYYYVFSIKRPTFTPQYYSGVHNVYVVIGYNGTIKMTEISITA